jgi:hypothetical protein
MSSGDVLQVDPKIPTEQNWAEAVVQLLDSDSRISVTGSQRSRQSARRSDLTTAIALEYARRLEDALAHEGPIQIFERNRLDSRRLNGHLNVSRWVRRSLVDPTLFPIERDELTVANDFSRGLSVVASYFRRSAIDPVLASRLRRLESGTLPGQALVSYVDPSVASRRLPPQWGRYRGAWDIASAVLRNRSVVGDPGHSVGLEVAIEPWPLLETLLERSLRALASDPALSLQFPMKRKHPVLVDGAVVAKNVEPDGVLRRDGQTIATFEAKYTTASDVPKESHLYQALTAAAVVHSPVAVLVYPGAEVPRVFDVLGFNGQPSKLATIGLDLYRYRRGGGGDVRARAIHDLLIEAGVL